LQRSRTTLSEVPLTAGGGIARLALSRAVASGINRGPILHAAGLAASVVDDSMVRMSVGCQVAVLKIVADALHDDLLGFHLGKVFDLRDIGLLYYVLASSASLREALTRAERYSTVTNEGIQVRCRPGGELGIRVGYIGVPRHADRHQMEFIMTALVRVCRHIADTHLRPVRISFVHPRCASSGELETFLGCRIDFAAGSDEIAFARKAGGAPLRGADSRLNEILIAFCEEVLARRLPRSGPIRVRVENAVAPLLPHGKAHVTDVARALGMSRRVLARQLAAEGLTFTRVLEEMRRDLAYQYLEDESLSVSRIAWLLGFGEVAAFTHAFKRWAGQSPTKARMEQRNGSGCS
jgi:AraC-like DNA-binding protein